MLNAQPALNIRIEHWAFGVEHRLSIAHSALSIEH